MLAIRGVDSNGSCKSKARGCKPTTLACLCLWVTVFTSAWDVAEAARYPAEIFYCPREPVRTTHCLTRSDYRGITSAIGDLIDGLPQECEGNMCPVADFVGCVLRLAGHDFMDFNGTGTGTETKGSGGSDGCLDFSDPDNAGLFSCMNSSSFDENVEAEALRNVSLQSVYAEFCHVVSVADFIVISAEAVMSKQSSTGQLEFEQQFAYGRTTNEACEGNPAMPNPEGSCNEVHRVFLESMGLSWREAAALMGVHTLGRAHPVNSGYDGWWSDAPNSARFNNNYYTSLVAKGWKPETSVHGNPHKNQWVRTDVGNWRNGINPQRHKEMMLNTDLCLVFAENDEPVSALKHDCCTWLESSDPEDLIFGLRNCGNSGACCGSQRQFSPRNGTIGCGNPHTPSGPAAKAVRDFHASENTWLSEFLPVWKKVTENGFHNLKPLESLGNCTPVIEVDPPFQTLSPSTSPSFAPITTAPTSHPSSSPSVSPSSAPTLMPSTSPTVLPTTLAPTLLPSKQPSSSPSQYPTPLPSTSSPTYSSPTPPLCTDGYVRFRNGNRAPCRVLKHLCRSHFAVAKACCATCSSGY